MKLNIRVLTLSSVHESLFRANPSPHTPKMKLRFCSGGLSSTVVAAGRLQVGKRETEGEGERAPRASPVSPPRAMGSSAIFSASVGLSLSPSIHPPFETMLLRRLHLWLVGTPNKPDDRIESSMYC